MTPRFSALKDVEKKNIPTGKLNTGTNSENFGRAVFSPSVMQKMLPKEIYKNVLNAMDGQEKIRPEYADAVALAVKEWAIQHGATHFCHWFQPLTGASAEKHDAFIDWHTSDSVIEKFNGKQLLLGEPDASSFPSGGLRSTYEARGYTGWDPTSPIFLWKAGDEVTLCIPSIYFSWTGNVLDTKIPLLRSNHLINQAAMRLLRLTGISAQYVYPTLGLEQEYFVIDRDLRNLRPDLVLLGKTVFGAPSPKGQELQDHYFGVVKDRILSFMCAFEAAAVELGIPVKTRHNEVAPAQHEIAPAFEKVSVALDHNILLMELMRRTAQKHQLACLLHEKPFAGINGSGKHANWSLSTDAGLNLLDPTDTPHNHLSFLILLTAIIHAVHRHSALLRASIGSASNDYRLGGHEAPPAIVSIYLGEALEHILQEIEHQSSPSSFSQKAPYKLELSVIPELSRDNTDRNRTSPLAFTGNKFEFRAVGSSANASFAITVLNIIVAESLNEILDEIEANQVENPSTSKEALMPVVMPILRKYIKASKGIRFTGDNYSHEWVKEAETRGLPNLQKSPESFAALTHPQTIKVFAGVLNECELTSRKEILLEHYVHTMNIETNLMIELFKTQILPVAIAYQHECAKSYRQMQKVLALDYSSRQHTYLKNLHEAIENGLRCVEELEQWTHEASHLTLAEKAELFSKQILEKMDCLRKATDELEKLVDDTKWPLPKYRELLFIV